MPARMILAMLVALNLLAACAQETTWKEFNEAGMEAHKQARYSEAEELLLAALEEAEKFEDPQNARLAATLNNLAVLYRTQGQFAEAEPLYQRSLTIQEKAWGPSTPMWPQASITWPRSTTPRVSMPRPSPCTSGP